MPRGWRSALSGALLALGVITGAVTLAGVVWHFLGWEGSAAELRNLVLLLGLAAAFALAGILLAAGE